MELQPSQATAFPDLHHRDCFTSSTVVVFNRFRGNFARDNLLEFMRRTDVRFGRFRDEGFEINGAD